MMARAAPFVAVVLSLAALAQALPVDPQPSLKHDTDVVRVARPGHVLLVDVIQPPASTADPVLTNEVDTSADSDLPRLVRLLVQGDELDAAAEELTRLKPPAPDQPAIVADWSAPADSATAAASTDSAAATATPSVASPPADLMPPPQDQPDEWLKYAGQQAGEEVKPAQSAAAQPRADTAGDEVVVEPSEELQPPPAGVAGLWELFEGLKAAQAVEAMAEARADEAKESPAEVAEPAAELVPPPASQPDSLTGLSAWTSQAAASASAAAPAKLAAPEPVKQPQGSPKDVPEPATHLLPPPPDSYAPAKPSSGEAGPDDFLSMGPDAAPLPPAADARADFTLDHADSYLPEAGELKTLAEGPVVDDFLAIGEPPKTDAAVGGWPVREDSAAAPMEAAKDEAKEDVKEDAKDSYLPTSEETSASFAASQEDGEGKVVGQDHDHEYVEVADKAEKADSEEKEGDDGAVSRADSGADQPAHRERLLLGKLGER